MQHYKYLTYKTIYVLCNTLGTSEYATIYLLYSMQHFTYLMICNNLQILRYAAIDALYNSL